MTIKKMKLFGPYGFLVVLGALVGLAGAPVSAVDDTGIFELDGNAGQNAIPFPVDWESLVLGDLTDVVAFTGIVPDPGQTTIFVGGRKDIQELDKWGWKDEGGFPDKNDITNAYAVAYNNQAGELVVYFGADRFSNTGDAFLGFWFFKEPVSLNPDGSFDGEHSEDDTLVLVNFPQASNAVPEIQVVTWDPTCSKADSSDPLPGECAAANLRLQFQGSGAGGAICGTLSPDPLACAITNDVTVSSYWDYESKDGFVNQFPFETFFEGGINLTRIQDGAPQCFSSFMAETRSSSSFTASLKDFVLGDFPVCKIEVTKTCECMRLMTAEERAANPGKYFVVSFSGEVTNNGGGAFPAGEVLRVWDDAGTPEDPTDDPDLIEIVLATPLGPDESVSFSGEFFTADNPPMNTITAEITFGANEPIGDSFTIQCVACDLPSTLAVTKECLPTDLVIDGGRVVVQVNFTGTVTNTGGIPLLVTVTDDEAGVVFGPEEIPEGESRDFEGSYLPSEIDQGSNPCDALFKNTVTASGVSLIPPIPDPDDDTATVYCPLCPPVCDESECPPSP